VWGDGVVGCVGDGRTLLANSYRFNRLLIGV